MRKMISILLLLAMLAAMGAPALAAEQAQTEKGRQPSQQAETAAAASTYPEGSIEAWYIANNDYVGKPAPSDCPDRFYRAQWNPELGVWRATYLYGQPVYAVPFYPFDGTNYAIAPPTDIYPILEAKKGNYYLNEPEPERADGLTGCIWEGDIIFGSVWDPAVGGWRGKSRSNRDIYVDPSGTINVVGK